MYPDDKSSQTRAGRDVARDTADPFVYTVPMKVISRFRDYYDLILAHGQDKDIVYVRQYGQVSWSKTPHGLPEVPWMARSTSRWPAGSVGPASACLIDRTHHGARNLLAQQNWWHWHPMRPAKPNSPAIVSVFEAFVLVAGQAYPVWLRQGAGTDWQWPQGRSTPGLGSPSLDRWLTRFEQAHRPGPSKSGPKEAKSAPKIECVQRFQRQHYLKLGKLYAQACTRFLAHDYTDLHIEQGAPVLLLASTSSLFDPHVTERQGSDPITLIRNPCLADLEFQRVLDPYTCFQNIAMFIGGVMPGRQMPMVHLTDTDRLLKRGFDPVYGFRKRPET